MFIIYCIVLRSFLALGCTASATGKKNRMLEGQLHELYIVMLSYYFFQRVLPLRLSVFLII